MSVLSKRPSTGRTPAANKANLLDATVRLLERGSAFAELSIGAISEEASVTRPTFYSYFQDKRDLMLALGDRFEDATHGAADNWLIMRDDDLEGALNGVLEAFRANHAALRAIVEAATYDGEVAKFWRRFHERFISAVVIRARQLSADRSDEELEAEAFALVWMTQRSVAEHLDAPRVSDAALITALTRLWRATLPATAG